LLRVINHCPPILSVAVKLLTADCVFNRKRLKCPSAWRRWSVTLGLHFLHLSIFISFHFCCVKKLCKVVLKKRRYYRELESQNLTCKKVQHRAATVVAEWFYSLLFSRRWDARNFWQWASYINYVTWLVELEEYRILHQYIVTSCVKRRAYSVERSKGQCVSWWSVMSL